MSFPLRHTVTRLPYEGQTTDGLGNATGEFGDPQPLGVYAIAPHTVEQGSATATQTQVADIDVYAPKTPVSLKDRFVIDGDDFEVTGVQDWTKGFHGFQPGIVVQLQRVT